MNHQELHDTVITTQGAKQSYWRSYLMGLAFLKLFSCSPSPQTVEVTEHNTDLNQLHYDVIIKWTKDINNELQKNTYIVGEPTLTVTKTGNLYEASLSAPLTPSQHTHHTKIERRGSRRIGPQAEQKVDELIQQQLELSHKNCNIDTITTQHGTIVAKEIFYKYYK